MMIFATVRFLMEIGLVWSVIHLGAKLQSVEVRMRLIDVYFKKLNKYFENVEERVTNVECAIGRQR